ncbi:MAG: bifunctional class I SAM-dependent methyltransferase/HIT family protein [Mariniphaga sp.]
MNQENNSHLTAKDRDRMSFPTNWLRQNNLLKGSILDFGCGLGKDVSELKIKGYECDGYDIFHFPNYPLKKYDTVICQYVLNVLQESEQLQVIMEISQLLNTGGVAYFTVRRDIRYEGFRIHKIHQKPTYQCNVVLPFKSILLNDFCEIFSFQLLIDTPQKSSCIFCRPSINLKYIAESVTAYATYDGYPVSKGHALIIPKKHISSYFELTPKEQFELWQLANFVQKYLLKKYSPDGFNVGININKSAGQTIFHAHIHLIPRYTGDIVKPNGGVRHVLPSKGYYENDESI